jgi:hypothetical protein
LGQRSRKRGRRARPAQTALGTGTAPSSAGTRPASAPAGTRASQAAARPGPAGAPARGGRGEERDAAIRATLAPYAPGERPWSIRLGALVALLVGGVQLALFLLGVKLKVAGTHAKGGSTIVFGLIMFVCAGGVWMMRYWAVLGFMALLALFTLYFALALIKVSSLLGLVIALAGLGVCGALFYKLVRVLGRIQMPRYPTRD